MKNSKESAVDDQRHVGLQEITSSGSVPTIGEKSSEYGGFTDASVYRPLVANSQQYFKDPES